MKKSTIGVLIHFDLHAGPLDARRIGTYLQSVAACFAGLSGRAEIVCRDAASAVSVDVSEIAQAITPDTCFLSDAR